MTQEQQDAAWRSLPEDYKEEVRTDYENAKAAHELDPTNVRIDMHIIYLEKYFGKHNLTASEEVEPRFKVGDLVLVKKDFDFGSNFGLASIFCTIPHPIKGIEDGKAFLQNDWYGSNNSEYALVPLDYLIPYTEEQEPKPEPGIHLKEGKSEFKAWFGDNPSISMTAPIESDKQKTMHIRTKHGTVTIPTKIEYDDSFWLAYRMELAKDIAVELIRSGNDTTFLAESTSLIVDGIVRRLKGGDK